MTCTPRLGHVLALVCLLPSAHALHRGNAGPTTFTIPGNLPPPPVRTPAEAVAEFRLAEPGLEVQVVAAEPMIEAPVAISFDALGRLYVCEMRGYMRDLDGKMAEEPTGRISLLEDTNGDGIMDKANVFLDGLIMPRAVLAIGVDGALVAEPPNLIHWQDTDGDGKADKKTLVASDFGKKGGQPEHMANSPLHALDNWIVCSNHGKKYRLTAEGWISEPHTGRGQWGLTQDDFGRPYFNYNSDLLRTDAAPPSYSARNPNLSAKLLFNRQVLATQEVWPAHPTPGINRGYTNPFRADGSMKTATATCGPGVYRGDLMPALHGDVFIPEPAGNLVKRVRLTEKDGVVTAANAYKELEFLTSPDERFRPVNCLTGPDGALYIVDLYRGILQDTGFLTHYLTANIEQRKLDKPWDLGRIYRVVPKGTKPAAVKIAADTPGLVAQLQHANGAVRDLAQQRLVARPNPAAADPVATAAATATLPAARAQAWWTLDGMGGATADRLTAGFSDASPAVRAAVLRIGERWLNRPEKVLLLPRVLTALEGATGPLRLQGALTLGAVVDPQAEAAFLALLATGPVTPELAEAAVSGLRGREALLLEKVAAHPVLARSDALTRALSSAVWQEGKGEKVQRLLASLPGMDPATRSALVATFADLSSARKGRLLHLPADGSALGAWTKDADKKTRDAWAKVDAVLAWPGKPGVPPPPVVKPLNETEQALFAKGKVTYETLCAACHQVDGRGLAGLAPTLADSEWVTGSEGRLARIVLHGLTGPIRVAGTRFEMDMPPLGQLADEDIAGVLTYIRRAWDHTANPVSAGRVKAIREETKARATPWTEKELQGVR